MSLGERLLHGVSNSRSSRSALAVAAASRLAPLLRWRLQRSPARAGLCLVYHRIGDPQGDPSRELVPALGSARFAAQLAHVRRRYRLVRAADLEEAVRTRRAGQRFPLAITFDDDLSSHSEVAMPALLAARVPATFFVCGASLSGPFSFWWERLQRASDRGALADARVEDLGLSRGMPLHELAGAVQRLPPRQRDEVAERLAVVAGPDPADAGLRQPDLRRLVDAGFDVGFHTLRHYDLACLDDETLSRALEEGRGDIEAAIDRRLELIAYPHGSADERVTAGAAQVGFDAGFIVGEAAATTESDSMAVERLEPTYRSASAFALKLVLLLRRASRAAAERDKS